MNQTPIYLGKIVSNNLVDISQDNFIYLFGIILTALITILVHLLISFKENKRIKFERFDRVTQRILENQSKITKYLDKKKIPIWEEMILNDCEYISYLVNNKKIDFQHVSGYLNKILINNYERLLSPKDQLDSDKYKEFTTLYNKIKIGK